MTHTPTPRDFQTRASTSREEEHFAISLADLAQGTLGSDAAVLLSGDALLEPAAAASLLLSVFATGRAPSAQDAQVAAVADAVRAQLAPAAAPGGNDIESVDDVIAAVRDLSPEESAVLQASATPVAEALWDRLVTRLEGSLLADESVAGETAVAAR